MSTRKWLRALFGVAVGGVFVWLLVRGVDVEGVGDALAGLSVGSVCLAVLLVAAGAAVRIARWWSLLRVLAPSLPLLACARPYLFAWAVNNLLPFRAGDAVRVLAFRTALRSPPMRVLGTLVVERCVDVVLVSGIFFLALIGLPKAVLPDAVVAAIAALAVAAMVGMALTLAFLPTVEGLALRLLERPALARRRWTRTLAEQGRQLTAALGLLRSPSRLAAYGCLSMLAWSCDVAVAVVLAAALEAKVAPLGPLLGFATGTLSMTIPVAPGHVGTFDYFAALGLAAYGAAAETAVAFAVALHALWIPFTVIGLLCWFPRRTPPPNRHRKPR